VHPLALDPNRAPHQVGDLGREHHGVTFAGGAQELCVRPGKPEEAGPKEAGLALTDRIRLTLPEADADLTQYTDWIAEEVLAIEIVFRDVSEPQIAQA